MHKKIFQNIDSLIHEFEESLLDFYKRKMEIYSSFFSLLSGIPLKEIVSCHILSRFFVKVVRIQYRVAERYKRMINRGVKFTLNFEDDLGMLLNAFLRSKLKNIGNNLEIKVNYSYRFPQMKRGQKGKSKIIRPDISVRRKNEDVPYIVIEIKNDLGYGRKTWYKRFNRRIEDFKKLGIPRDAIFFIVITTDNWLHELSLTGWKVGISEEILKKEKRKVKLPSENMIFLFKLHPNANDKRDQVFEHMKDEYFCDFLEPAFLKIRQRLLRIYS